MEKRLTPILLFLAMMATSCQDPIVNEGQLVVQVNYCINEKPLVTDTLAYHNEAGNLFLINEIQWFISNLEFQDGNGKWIPGMTTVYIDTNIPGRQTLHLALPLGSYHKLRFTFGLNEADNQTGRFRDPPERDMLWPDPLGGGYHYMKLNGKYLDNSGNLVPLNIHLGIGQNHDLTEFYQNYFIVELPVDLTISEYQDSQLGLTMNIDNWFRNPNIYDFTTDGSAIMQNQAAQVKLKENGADVFSIQTINDMKSLSEISRQLMKMAAPKPHFLTWENLKDTFTNITTKEHS